MEIINIFKSKIADKRDIFNFLTFRAAEAKDDIALGEFLIKTHNETGKEKNVANYMCKEKEIALSSTRLRRENAYVRIVELGKEIVGTYALHHPKSITNDSWIENSHYFSTFAIHPILHGLGFGKVLMIDAQMKALKQESEYMTLHVNIEAIGLQKFYESFNFIFDPRGNRERSGINVKGYQCKLDFIEVNNLLKIV